MEELFNYKGWPWAETSRVFPEQINGNKGWPKLSIVIPSFEQGQFIEETILSVINQNYPNLELIIIDGGSNDQTVEIIKKYEKYISYWVSEKDNGQSHAINKGFSRCTGEWIAWINSDDCYLKDAFYHLFVENKIEGQDFLYGNYYYGKSLGDSKEIKIMDSDKISFSSVIRFFFGINYIIPSQSVFVRKILLDKVGLLNESLHYCMDVEWYARIFREKPSVLKYNKTICFFRYNKNTKTGSLAGTSSEDNKMGIEAEQVALSYSAYLGFWDKIRFNNLYSYYLMYSKEPQKYDNCSLWYLLKILMRHPFKSVTDRRILGLFKRKLLMRS